MKKKLLLCFCLIKSGTFLGMDTPGLETKGYEKIIVTVADTCPLSTLSSKLFSKVERDLKKASA